MTQQTVPSADELRVLLREIMHTEGIGVAPSRNWLEDLLHRIAPWGKEAFGGSALMLIFLLFLFSLFVWFAWKLAQNWPGRARVQPTLKPSNYSLAERLTELQSMAMRADQEGDYRTAIFNELYALVLALAQAGSFELRSAWTLREWLERIPPAHTIRERLTKELNALDPILWGRRSAARADLTRVRELSSDLIPETRR